MAEVDKILAERGKVHGPFHLHAAISQQLKQAMWDHYPPMAHPQREALEMIQHKIARILAGDPNHIDHWDDIAGYATLMANILRENSMQVLRSVVPGGQTRATVGGLHG